MSTPALEIKDLSFRYRAAEEDFELKLASLRLEPGEQMLLRAGSGRGKSTLLSLISGLMDPQAGTIHVAGKNIHALTGAARDTSNQSLHIARHSPLVMRLSAGQ